MARKNKNRRGRKPGEHQDQQGEPSNVGGQAQTLPEAPKGAATSEETPEDSREECRQKPVNMPRRPKYVTGEGPPSTLQANCVKLNVDKSLTLHRYNIKVTGKEDGKKRKGKDRETDEEEGKSDVKGKKLARIIELFLMKEHDELGDAVTDFAGILITFKKVTNRSSMIGYYHEFESEPENAVQYEVSIEHHKSFHPKALLNHLGDPSKFECKEKEHIVQALHIFLNHYPRNSKNYVTIGSSRSFPLDTPTIDLGPGMIARKGYFSSIHLATTGILVNINPSWAAFYDDKPLKELMDVYTNQRYDRNVQKLSQFLRGARIKYDMPQGDNRTPRLYTIFGIASTTDGTDYNGTRIEGAPIVEKDGATPAEVKFGSEGKDEQMTVLKYFSEKRNYEILHERTPLVNVGTRRKPIHLPPELCTIIRGQRPKINLDHEEDMRNMVEVATGNPKDDSRDIPRIGVGATGMSSNNKENTKLKQFGLSISDPSLVKVQGHTLHKPKVRYCEGIIKIDPGKPPSWNLRDCKLSSSTSPKNWKNWSVVIIRSPNVGVPDDGLIQKLRYKLENNGVKLRLVSTERTTGLIGNLETDLSNIFRRVKNTTCVLVVLPDNRQSTYNCVKTLGDVVFGITTICVVGSKLIKAGTEGEGRGLGSFAGNLALKFNLKFNNYNQYINEDDKILDLDETMIVGIDVTHSPNSEDPSIAAMVASVDSKLGQWPAVLRRQTEARVEMVSHLKEMLETRLELWKSKSKSQSYPKNILVYRDGVSEGQYNLVLSQELLQLEAACNNLYPRNRQESPKITIVIVAKRHHIRFYTDKGGNPFPATAVDRDITESDNWDFFLQPHKAIKGVARPIHYIVIHDNIFQEKFKEEAAEKMENFTHRLCYIFGRSTSAVSICTPAYYADIACERGRCYLAGGNVPTPGVQTTGPPPTGSLGLRVHPNLKDSMFYI